LTHGRQGRHAEPHPDRIVIAQDRQLARHGQAARLGDTDRAQRHLVVGGHDRGRRFGQVQQRLGSGHPGLEREVALVDPLVRHGQARRLHGRLEGLDPQDRRREFVVAGDHADACVTQAQQVLGRLPRRGPIIHVDPRPLPAHRGVQPHERDIALLQRAQNDRVLAVRRRQDHAVGLQRRQHRGDLLFQLVRLAVDQFEHQVIARLLTAQHRAVQHLVDPLVAALAAPVVQRQAAVVESHQQVGARSGHGPRGLAGAVAQLFDGLEHTRLQVWRDVGLVVEHPRHRLDRHARLFGDMDDRGRPLRHSESVSPGVRTTVTGVKHSVCPRAA
jgi:hypothetical protein